MIWPEGALKRLSSDSLRLAFSLNRRARAQQLITLSIALFILIFILRFAVVDDPRQVIFLLCVVPIALLAIALGMVGGLAAAAFSYAIYVFWAIGVHAPVNALDYLARALAFFSVGGFVGYFTTESRRSEERGRRWFDLSLDIGGMAGFDGFWKRVNPSFMNALGYTQEELLARPFLDFVHEEDRQSTTEASAKLGSGIDVVGFQNRYRAKDGVYHWIDWACTTVPSEQLIYASGKDVTKRKELEEQLRYLAQHDGLTSLFNRRRFDEELSRLLAHVRRYGSSAVLILIDVDNFKQVNDMQGHAAGDEVLKTVAGILTKHFRSTDISARLGGDEFAVLLTKGNGVGAERAATKLLFAMHDAVGNDEGTGAPTLSIGMALIDSNASSSPDLVMGQADAAMYIAKREGGNRFATYSKAQPPRSLAASGR
jgi:diguanylate cyclase (GGDEF)-like protein/PAS domain S-box-containing protein